MEKLYIAESAWAKIFAFLREIKGLRVKNEEKTRLFVEGAYCMARAGMQWRELPERYGSWRALHKRFLAWSRKDIWNAILGFCAEEGDYENVAIDSTVVRAHACAAGYEKNQGEREGLGRSKGGFSTKIHVAVDALGNPFKYTLTPGQRSDISQASELIEGVEDANVLADKAYDCDAFIAQCETQGCKAVIPPKANRKVKRDVDYCLYKERHVVECLIGKLKYFRRVFSRFDKTAVCYLGFVAFASIFIWLK